MAYSYQVGSKPTPKPPPERFPTMTNQLNATTKRKMSFEEWTKAVDAICCAKYGLGVDDGCDWPSMDMYEDGATPREGARAWREAQD
jgi:hypothetical protein